MSFRHVFRGLIFAALLLSYGSFAHASICSGVKFNFENKMASKVKIEEIIIKGNSGSWSHSVKNKVVFSGDSYTTGKVRLIKLDAGASGSFKVKYKRFDVDKGKWRINKSDSQTKITCDNNMTIRFELK